ncbi:High-affinity nickel-transporter [Bacillus canaveralius]|uniref:Nickel/cobalt efflux system n=1 Tax=Bacillus canaveralius TaxID=1403243 RepID=A0A2N5GHU5_9BACI|nr:High-affinity nickel-transporter [Bacillus canaveralius]PLR80379.1 High-affinity nickel-transporter [Bacillus canaveralius]PLR88866.1 High-affinity nickel-transporter [Bacillus canaveralius]
MELITFALLAILIGMRHGMDGDHVAAIADMVGSEEQKTKQVSLGIMYALGHGMIVLIVGFITIFIGAELPATTRGLMEVLVSLTLIILGGFILYSLLRQRNEYEYKSRLTIVYESIAKLMSKLKLGIQKKSLSTLQLGIASAFVIGIIHGIGVESPTQIALLTNAAGLNNMTTATIQLILFVLGLLISTVCITFFLSWGFLKARLKRQLYFVLGSITGMYSLGLGISMLVGFWKGGA